MVQEEKSQEETENKMARAEFHIGEVELKFAGPPDWVQKNVDKYFEPAANLSYTLAKEATTMKLTEQQQVPTISPVGLISNSDNNITVVRESSDEADTDAVEIVEVVPDIGNFYRSKAPNSQAEQITVITYHYQIYQGYQCLSANDYKEALVKLRRVGAKPVDNVNLAAISAEKRGFVYRPEPDVVAFALSYDGEEYVKNMSKSQENK